MPSHILMVAPATDKSRHGNCAVTTLLKEKSGMAGALGRGGGMMVLLAARAPASKLRARVGEVRLRVDFNR